MSSAKATSQHLSPSLNRAYVKATWLSKRQCLQEAKGRLAHSDVYALMGDCQSMSVTLEAGSPAAALAISEGPRGSFSTLFFCLMAAPY